MIEDSLESRRLNIGDLPSPSSISMLIHSGGILPGSLQCYDKTPAINVTFDHQALIWLTKTAKANIGLLLLLVC